MSSDFTILLAGALAATPRLKQQIASTRVIAANGGMAQAQVLQIRPELWIGDFDSASPELLAEYTEVERIIYPVTKDASDGELAIEAALVRGASKINLVGGLGWRSDHTLAHMMLLWRLTQRGLLAMLSNGYEEVWPLLGSHGSHLPRPSLASELVLTIPRGTCLSIIPWTDLKSLSLSGVHWPLECRDVDCGSTMTLSNITTEEEIRVRLIGGSAMVMLAYNL